MALARARHAIASVQSQQITGSGLGTKSSQAVVVLKTGNKGLGTRD